MLPLIAMTPEDRELKNYGLFYAIAHESPDEIRARIKNGADVNFRLPASRDEVDALDADNLAHVLKELHGEAKFDKQRQEDYENNILSIGITTLQHAIHCKRPAIVELLLEFGADPLKESVTVDNFRPNALEYAFNWNGMAQERGEAVKQSSTDCIDKLIRRVATLKPDYPFLEAAIELNDGHSLTHILDLHRQGIITIPPEDFDRAMQTACNIAPTRLPYLQRLLEHPATREHYKIHGRERLKECFHILGKRADRLDDSLKDAGNDQNTLEWLAQCESNLQTAISSVMKFAETINSAGIRKMQDPENREGGLGR